MATKMPKVGSKFGQILNKPSKTCQSGEILPILVTLEMRQMCVWWEREHYMREIYPLLHVKFQSQWEHSLSLVQNNFFTSSSKAAIFKYVLLI